MVLTVEVLAVFANARDIWMDAYVRALYQYRQKYSPGGPEVLLQLSANGAPDVYRLYRADLGSGATSPPNLTEVNLDGIAEEPAQFVSRSSGIELSIQPIQWNGVEFVVEGVAPEDPSLEEWCRKWLDVEETGELDEHGLLGAIHSMTAPQQCEGGICFSVDFGTAAIAAVSELLAVLAKGGARSAKISSPWAYQT